MNAIIDTEMQATDKFDVRGESDPSIWPPSNSSLVEDLLKAHRQQTLYNEYDLCFIPLADPVLQTEFPEHVMSQ